MDGGLLSLKWNNHRSTLFYMLSTVRKKECYTDVTLACDGKFYSVHKLVLSMCSEYFEQMFEQTQCKHPVIVLKDIKSEELESLLSYMYVGEVNVVQEKLSGLIKAAECLKIKGLAVPDEEPCSKTSTSREKRSSDNSLNSEPKRRRQDDSGSTSSFRQAHSNNRNDDRRKSLDHPSSSSSNKFRNTNNSNSNVNSNRSSSGDRESGERGSTSFRAERRASPANNNKHQSSAEVKTEEQAETAEPEALEEVVIEEPSQAVKEEPTDADAVYLSDSDSVPDHKDEVLLDSFSDVGQQQHFMDELLGGASESNQGNMGVGDYSEVGEGSSGAGDQQQQHMGRTTAGLSGSLPDNLQQEHSTTGRLPLQRPEPPYNNRLAAPSRRRPPSFQARNYPDHLHLQHPYSASVLELTGGPPSSIASWGQEPSTSSQTQGSLGGQQSSWDGASSLAFHSGSFNLEDFLPLSGEGGDASSTAESDSQGQACPHCGKVFRDRSNFYRHRLVHTKEKPYQCPLCDYRSSRSDNVKRHLVVRHPEFTEASRPEEPLQSPQ